jgi:hypothetical protein
VIFERNDTDCILEPLNTEVPRVVKLGYTERSIDVRFLQLLKVLLPILAILEGNDTDCILELANT